MPSSLASSGRANDLRAQQNGMAQDLCAQQCSRAQDLRNPYCGLQLARGPRPYVSCNGGAWCTPPLILLAANFVVRHLTVCMKLPVKGSPPREAVESPLAAVSADARHCICLPCL